MASQSIKICVCVGGGGGGGGTRLRELPKQFKLSWLKPCVGKWLVNGVNDTLYYRILNY